MKRTKKIEFTSSKYSNGDWESIRDKRGHEMAKILNFFAIFLERVCWTVKNIKFDVLSDGWDENGSTKQISSYCGRKLMNMDYCSTNKLFLRISW